uniref:Uncharacterized protein n=1 Tax=Schizaphis graminum TaxID=13262 RepID=A0A2S2PPC1_SCHGA
MYTGLVIHRSYLLFGHLYGSDRSHIHILLPRLWFQSFSYYYLLNYMYIHMTTCTSNKLIEKNIGTTNILYYRIYSIHGKMKQNLEKCTRLKSKIVSSKPP